MKACDMMSDRFAECYIDDSIDALKGLLREERTDLFVVLDEKGKPAGVVDNEVLAHYDRARHDVLTGKRDPLDLTKSNSIDDTAIHIDSQKEPTRNWMREDFVTLNQHASLQKVVKAFGDGHTAYCLVLDDETKRTKGIISKHDVHAS